MLASSTVTDKPPRRRVALPRVLHLFGLAAAVGITIAVFLIRDHLQQLDQLG